MRGGPPPLRFGEIEASEIYPYRINFNPATGRTIRPPDLPAGYGCDVIRPHPDPDLRESFARDGITNPVFLWTLEGRLWVRYGGSRIHFAQQNGLSLRALIADYDDRFPDWERVEPREALTKWTTPPVGLVPSAIVVDGDRIDLEVQLWRDFRSSPS